MVPFYRYWKLEVSDHFYTINPHEIGTTMSGERGRHGYRSEGIQSCIYELQVEGSVPLYRYWKSSASDHFYTTSNEEIGTTTHGQVGRHGYASEGIAGYCYPTQKEGTVPMYRYWNQHNHDHFYTTNIHEIGTVTAKEVGRDGYISEGVVCYVPPA